MNSFRTKLNSELGEKNIGQNVIVVGWVNSIRNHGKVIFIMIRDHTGIIQCVTHDGLNKKYFSLIEGLKEEYVVQINGVINQRSEDTINEKIDSGKIEIEITEIKILNICKTLPFKVSENSPVFDDAIKYRYLYLRRKKARDFIVRRYQVTYLIRNFLNSKNFVEIETPLLTKTTPEGARDFLVPSRVYLGEFYALPQSPQQYKQLLMVAGFNRYFQIARALRDEDSRADRQAEHTQIDMELSYVERDEIINLLEELIMEICTKLFDVKRILFNPFPRITYQESMKRYGTDKPDLRFDLEINDVSTIFKNSQFKIFENILSQAGKIKAIKWTRSRELSRKELDDLIGLAINECKMSGLIWIQFQEKEWKSSIKKYISEEEITLLKQDFSIQAGDVFLLGGGIEKKILKSMGLLRNKIAYKFNLFSEEKLAFVFVVDFPLLEWNNDENRYDPLHHMFVLPKIEDINKIDSDPLNVISTQFDLVCNGYELCSGSLRIFQSALQKKIMKLIGLNEQEIEKKFSHLLKAFDYGAPPHGGAAPGLDRLMMVLMQTSNIRDVIAFPKTQKGQDLMMNSPSPASAQQLVDLGLTIDKGLSP